MRSEEAILRLLFCMSSFVPVFFLARFQQLEALFPIIDIAGVLIPAFFTVTAHNTKGRGHNLPPLSVHFGHFTTFFVTKALYVSIPSFLCPHTYFIQVIFEK